MVLIKLDKFIYLCAYITGRRGRRPLPVCGMLLHRTVNVLHRYGVTTLQELLEYSEATVRKFHNLGKVSFSDIEEMLREIGMKLKEDTES